MGVVESRSPQNPADVVASAASAGSEGVAEAVRRARAAQRRWAGAGAAERAGVLAAAAANVAAAADELAALAVREVGKPVTEAKGEVARAVAILRYYSQQVFDPVGALYEPSGAGLSYTRRRPRGVAGLITPWNFPLAIPLWKAAPALAFGNAVVLKPAPQALGTALRLAEILGLPEELFQVVPGDAEEGVALIEAADVVSFTGSAAVGRKVSVAAATRGVPVQAEMGGQNPSIVLDDANLEAAAAQIAAAAFGYAGQKCTATKRVITVGNAGEVREALVAAVAKLGVGDPADPGTAVGPVIEESARDRVVASAEGGRVLTGGQALDRDGWFAAPTLVDGVAADHVLARDEVFGPICLVQDAGSVEEAVALANGVPYGLASAVYTRDLDRALEVSSRLESGLVKVNNPTSGVDFYLPFGGEKDSSYGPREQGKAAQEFYTSTHTIALGPAGA
ncbi:aldehyde dehydrogenase family protein [Sphaerisporangium sp. NPDC005288]|uniref:aldehyde dehydrogenase family protein n=1 Tax=Sphaerisporangium sp. NPDC005288 TaxID=3155114 RepID=UPI0033AEF01F